MKIWHVFLVFCFVLTISADSAQADFDMPATWNINITTEGGNTTEQIQDVVGTLLSGTETLINVTYDDILAQIDFIVTVTGNTSAEILALIPADTNATSICSDNEILEGSGTCLSLLTDWNITYNATYDAGMVDTDTNATTECGDNEILGGGGSCLSLLTDWNITYNSSYEYWLNDSMDDIYVNVSGDTMTGDLDMNANNIDNVNILNAQQISGHTITGDVNVSDSGDFGWGNISNYSLDSIWLGSLHWGNISNRNLDISWIGTLNYSNLTQCSATQILKANATGDWGCADDAGESDTDTNATTECGDNEVLDGSGTCLSLLTDWNITYNVTYDAQSDTDTNATTECADNEILDGSGTCISLLTDWNITYNVSYDSMLGYNTTEQMQDAIGLLLGGTETLINVTYDDILGQIDFIVTVTGNTSSEILALIPADTNATSICGDNEVLDGSGTCITLATDWNITYNETYDADVADVYVNVSGDNMTGNLNVVTINGSGNFNTTGNMTGNYGFFEYVIIGTSSVIDALTVSGAIDLIHTAIEADDHALEIDVDAAGFGDVKGINLFYDTGTITTGSDDAIILIDIDESNATGGDVFAVSVLPTEGSANIYGLKAGALVGPIHQDSGVFSDMDTANNSGVDELTNFTSTTFDVPIFVSDNDYIIIGDADKFEEIEFLLNTTSSNPGIKPTFGFSTGSGTWSSFTPVDGTNGMKNSGVIAWEDDDIPTWATGVGGEYLINVTRTRNFLLTTPIEDKVQISAVTEYIWNEFGDVEIRNLNASRINATDWSNVSITESQISDLVHIPDTNVTTHCPANNVLEGGGDCLDYYELDRNWANSLFYDNITHCAYEGEILKMSGGAWTCGTDDTATLTDTNASTGCAANQFLSGSGECFGLTAGWNETSDTNATTQCADNEVLDGSGNCISLLTDWNITYNASYDSNLDTNATTECADNEVLDGSGNCISLLTDWNVTYNETYDANMVDVYVNVSGDNMTGNITFTGNLSNGALLVGTEEGDSSILFFEADTWSESLYWDDSEDEFDFSDSLEVRGHLDVTDYAVITSYIQTSGDIYSTGSGDDLWLGTSTKLNAKFQANEDGSLNISSGAFFINTTGGLGCTDCINDTAIDFDLLTLADFTNDANFIDADTNATTQCGDDEVLDGSGSCIPLLADWNITYNATYDFSSTADTNATTECGDNEVLDGSGTCITLSTDWNITYNVSYDSTLGSNTTAEMVTAINTTDYYQFQAKNTSIVYNASYETLDFAWTGQLNVSGNLTSCASGQILKANATGQWGCDADDSSGDEETTQDNAFSALNGTQTRINATYDDPLGSIDLIVEDMANTSAEILALIPADTNATSICGDNEVLDGSGTCVTLSTDWNITYNVSYDSTLGTNTTAEMQTAVNTTDYYQFTAKNASQVYNATYDANIDTANTSAEMVTAINTTDYYQFQARNASQVVNTSYEYWDNATVGGNASICGSGNLVLMGNNSCGPNFNETINFTALTDASLDWVWKDSLHWGNLTAYTLDTAWSGSLHWGNLTAQSLDTVWTGQLNASGNLTSCASGEILKANATGQWGCAADAGGADTDTNASTACSGDQVLIGGGSCLSLLTDWNYTYNVTYDAYEANTANSTEEMQDAAGALLGGTETLINVTYDDILNQIDFIVTVTGNTSAEILAVVHTDTNATSICGDNEVLGGGGTCLSLLTDWNITYNATYDANIDTANSSAEMVTAINTTDYYQFQAKNASQVVNSSYEYWTNDSVDDIYVNVSGDTMTGNLNMGNQNITYVENITISDGTTPDAFIYWNGTNLVIEG